MRPRTSSDIPPGYEGGMKFLADFFRRIVSMSRHPVAAEAGIFAFAQYAASGLGFFTTIISARMLGPVGYGVATLVMAYPLLAWWFVGLKSAPITTRYICAFRASGKQEEIRAVCKLGYTLDLAVAIVTFLLVAFTSSRVTDKVLRLPGKAPLVIIYTASFIFLSLNSTSWAVLASWEKWRWLSFFQIFEKVIAFLLVLGLLLAGAGVSGVILGASIANVTLGLGMAVAAAILLFRSGIGFWWGASFKSILSLRQELLQLFSWNYLKVSLSGLMEQLPLLLLGRLRGPREAGFYRLASSLAMLGSYLESALGKVAYPALAVYWSKGDRGSLRKGLRLWTLHIGLPISIFLLMVIPVLPFIVTLIFGNNYRPAALAGQILMAAAAVSSLFFWLIGFFDASARISFWTKIYAVYALFALGFGWFFIQPWGFQGLACVMALGEIMFILCMAFCFRQSPFKL